MGSVIENPAWEYVAKVPNTDFYPAGDFRPRMFSTTNDQDYIGHRTYVTSQWSWAIPSNRSIKFIADILDGRPVVEIGAGNGYWAWMLSQHGVEVAAYDLHPVGHELSWFRDSEELSLPVKAEAYFDVQLGGVNKLADHPDHALFLCWPTMDPWAYDALRIYKGSLVIYIGEHGGCNADDSFFQELEANWTYVERGPLVAWEGIHDSLTVYERKQA